MGEVICVGSKSEILATAKRYANENGYESSWLYTDEPILKEGRTYALAIEDNGMLTVWRDYGDGTVGYYFAEDQYIRQIINL